MFISDAACMHHSLIGAIVVQEGMFIQTAHKHMHLSCSAPQKHRMWKHKRDLHKAQRRAAKEMQSHHRMAPSASLAHEGQPMMHHKLMTGVTL